MELFVGTTLQWPVASVISSPSQDRTVSQSMWRSWFSRFQSPCVLFNTIPSCYSQTEEMRGRRWRKRSAETYIPWWVNGAEFLMPDVLPAANQCVSYIAGKVWSIDFRAYSSPSPWPGGIGGPSPGGLTNYCPSVLDIVGWVMWPVKIVPNMTYNVFGGSLNPTLLLPCTSTEAIVNHV